MIEVKLWSGSSLRNLHGKS
uniref:Uncharacterized protein n=1 Tax=Rhizophora mucronata TaxID=61149 RepID=A0A2P2N613_RHIMU